MQLKATRSENGRLTDLEIPRQCFASDNVKRSYKKQRGLRRKTQ